MDTHRIADVNSMLSSYIYYLKLIIVKKIFFTYLQMAALTLHAHSHVT